MENAARSAHPYNLAVWQFGLRLGHLHLAEHVARSGAHHRQIARSLKEGEALGQGSSDFLPAKERAQASKALFVTRLKKGSDPVSLV
jgi:hypothetical protein